MTTKTLKDGLDATFSADLNLALGEQADAASKSVVLSTGSKALLTTLASILSTIDGHVDGFEAASGAVSDTAWTAGSGSQIALLKAIAAQAVSTAPVPVAQADEYETVAASATDQVIGATGATGDRLAGVLIQPGTTSPGNVIIKDGSTTIYTFPGGASSVTTLIPFVVPLGLKSVSGSWKVTTGANVTAIAIGDFT